MQFAETDHLSIVTYDIERVSGTDSAEEEFTIILEAEVMHNISVFDIEGDGSVGNISVDVVIRNSTVIDTTTSDNHDTGILYGLDCKVIGTVCRRPNRSYSMHFYFIL